LVDETHAVVLGLVMVTVDFAVKGSSVSGGESCVHSIPFSPDVAIAYQFHSSVFELRPGGSLRTTLEFEVTGPAEVEGQRVLVAPRARANWEFEASATDAWVLPKHDPTDAVFAPEWEGVRLALVVAGPGTPSADAHD
jgi:hypothetical protein